MSTRRLVILLTFLAIFAMSARISIDSDTWWHLRAGQWIVSNHVILQTDIFSTTRNGAPWNYPGWLVEVPLYWIYTATGAAGLNLWTAATVTLAFFFVWLTLSGGVFLRAFTLILATAVSAVYWAARPYLVTFLLAAIFLWVLEGWRWKPNSEKGTTAMVITPLMVIWANSHGGFAVGFILIGIYLAGEILGWLSLRWRMHRQTINDKQQVETMQARLIRLGIILALTVLAVCLNPAGPVMLLYPLKTVGIRSLQLYIQEWQSPDFHTSQVQPFLVMLLLTLAAVGSSRRRLALTDFLLISVFAYLGFLAGRNIALFALTAPPVLTRHAAPAVDALSNKAGFHLSGEQDTPPRLRTLNLILLLILLIAVVGKVLLVLPDKINEDFFQKTFPTGAVQFLKETHPPGNLFNTYNQGGYLIWALPEYPVFIDARTDLYNDELIQVWLKVMRAQPGWEDILKEYGIGIILVEPDAPIVNVLLESQNWKEGYRDKQVVIFLKTTG